MCVFVYIEREREREKNKQTETVLHLLIRSPSACNSQAGPGLSQASGIPARSPTGAAGTQEHEPAPAALHSAHCQEAGLNTEWNTNQAL